MSAARWSAAIAGSLAVATAVSVGGYVAAARAEQPPPAPLGPGDVTVRIDAHYTTFAPDRLRVAEGTRVRFLIVNGDPINHELIVGPPAVHARHARGTEAEHPAIPGEVSVGPNDMAMTTYTFDEPGTFEFACHLPRHHEYGMHGVIEVVPTP